MSVNTITNQREIQCSSKNKQSRAMVIVLLCFTTMKFNSNSCNGFQLTEWPRNNMGNMSYGSCTRHIVACALQKYEVSSK